MARTVTCARRTITVTLLGLRRPSEPALRRSRMAQITGLLSADHFPNSANHVTTCTLWRLDESFTRRWFSTSAHVNIDASWLQTYTPNVAHTLPGILHEIGHSSARPRRHYSTIATIVRRVVLNDSWARIMSYVTRPKASISRSGFYYLSLLPEVPPYRETALWALDDDAIRHTPMDSIRTRRRRLQRERTH